MWHWLRRRITPAGAENPPELLSQAKSTDEEIRRASAERLATVTEPWAGPALLDLLGDGHSVVRQAATDAFRRLGSGAAPILQKGLDHAVPEVGRASAELLGEVGSSDAADPLLVALKYGPRPVQIAAKKALIKLGSASVPSLESARDETHPWVRQQIEEALAAIQGNASSASRSTPA